MTNNIIFKDKHIRILLALRDTTQSWYIASLAKASNTTYVHVCNFLNSCEGLGITGSEKHGKIKLIKLTEKGTRLADTIASAYSLVNEKKEEKEKEPQIKQATEPQK